jgi:hypothetical protein
VVPGLFDPQALNRYSYVLNDPLNRIDPGGNASIEIGLGFGTVGYDSERPGSGFSGDWGASLGASLEVGGLEISAMAGFSSGEVSVDFSVSVFAGTLGVGYDEGTPWMSPSLPGLPSLGEPTSLAFGDSSQGDFQLASGTAESNSPDAVRGRMADIAEAHLGDAAFAKDARYGKWPAGAWKCNCFVEYVIESAGGTAPRYPGGQWPLRANDWANPDLNISGWAIVTSPQRGDVAAFPRAGDSGHVGIFVGGLGRQVIGAGRGGVAYSTTHLFTRFGLNSLSGATGPIVYRRWVGPGI